MIRPNPLRKNNMYFKPEVIFKSQNYGLVFKTRHLIRFLGIAFFLGSDYHKALSWQGIDESHQLSKQRFNLPQSLPHARVCTMSRNLLVPVKQAGDRRGCTWSETFLQKGQFYIEELKISVRG